MKRGPYKPKDPTAKPKPYRGRKLMPLEHPNIVTELAKALEYYRNQIEMVQAASLFLDVAPDNIISTAERKLGHILFRLLKLAQHFEIDVDKLIKENLPHKGSPT